MRECDRPRKVTRYFSEATAALPEHRQQGARVYRLYDVGVEAGVIGAALVLLLAVRMRI
jgi:hypothetical protein